MENNGTTCAVTPREQQQQQQQQQQEEEEEEEEEEQQQQQQYKQKREDAPAPASDNNITNTTSASPTKKRRKVNHAACIYCRRSHMTCDLDRPCTRCVKRNIGHLCHDEPREPAKLAKIQPEHVVEDDDASLKYIKLGGDNVLSPVDQLRPGEQVLHQTELDTAAPTVPTNGHTSSAQLVEPSPASRATNEPSGVKNQPCTVLLILAHSDWALGGQSQFQDMHNFHPSYMFNAPEVTSEYNLFNDFLSTSLLNDGAMFPSDEAQGLYSDSPLINTVVSGVNGHGSQYLPGQMFRTHSPGQVPAAEPGDKTRRSSVLATDKARETYYMTAADPAGSDTPGERMDKLLMAKYDAGMLKPFNYVKGYARLDQYIEQHMQVESRQRIRRALDKFRPTFRERMQALTDYELVRVEMWFERSLMEYDRVFASMAIPACCWRRTGEICRGNKEMAQMIHVPIEQLRDVGGFDVDICYDLQY
ncbi:MAG: hypothetical protein L6R37_005474 [Teloschistes peruensis]|nr:MAG: hypothetical protein L6R37_005474 [Teloschistes peruensis]